MISKCVRIVTKREANRGFLRYKHERARLACMAMGEWDGKAGSGVPPWWGQVMGSNKARKEF